MRVIIAGAGEVGRGVASALRQEKRSVALIDPDPSAINESIREANDTSVNPRANSFSPVPV